MSFAQAYSSVKQCIVAVVKQFYSEQQDFSEIIGTGFFVSELGLVCTCRHVADKVRSLPRPVNFKGIPANVLLFTEFSHNGEQAVGVLHIDIAGIGDATVIGDTSDYLGPNPPDISFLLLDVTETPSVELVTQTLQEGTEVAFAGFPMGTETLRAPGWIHQFSPTLHSGLVSAVLPYQSVALPHGFLVHANTQGGSSGSPVFGTDGKVIGMVYMGLEEEVHLENDSGSLHYRVPTSLTGCLSSEVIAQVLTQAEKQVSETNRQTLESYMASRKPKRLIPGSGFFDEWSQLESE